MIGDVDRRVLHRTAVGENFPLDGADFIPAVGSVQFYVPDIGDDQRVCSGVVGSGEICFCRSRGEFRKRQRFGSGFKLGKSGFGFKVIGWAELCRVDGKKVFAGNNIAVLRNFSTQAQYIWYGNVCFFRNRSNFCLRRQFILSTA